MFLHLITPMDVRFYGTHFEAFPFLRDICPSLFICCFRGGVLILAPKGVHEANDHYPLLHPACVHIKYI